VDTLLTVFILGLSVEGVVLCPFFAFGLSLSDRLAGLRFLLGRLTGLVCFGVLISMLGKTVHIDERLMNLIFGLSIIILGLYRSINLDGTDLGWKLRVLKVRLGFKSRCSGKGKQGKAGFGLGLFRGLCNPGRKYLYLAPFLLDLGVFKGLAVSFVYGVSSSVYLLLGFISAGFVNRLAPHRQQLTIVSGIVLIIVGGYYVWKAHGLIA
jgi:cytochrome c biogenesis protein CcdA